jgi:hypothetical protein
MLESTSLTSLGELERTLKSIDERLKYLENVVLPSRVTHEELHAAITDTQIHSGALIASLNTEIRILRQQMATKTDLDQLRTLQARPAAVPTHRRRHTATTKGA